VTSADVAARSLADAIAGGSLADLRAREAAAKQAVDAWYQAYEAALAATVAALADPTPLSVRDAARALGCGETKVRELIRCGRLRRVEGLGDAVRVVRADVERLRTPPPGGTER